MLKSMINPDLSLKRISLVLGFLLIMLSAMSPNLMAANQVVTNNLDDGPGSLRQAINDVLDGETITFDADYTITLASQLTINKSMTITGTGDANTIIQANAAPNVATYRVFNIETGHTVTLSDMSIKNGHPGADGGGIYNAGKLTLSNVIVLGNNATTFLGGGIYSTGTIEITNSEIRSNSTIKNGGGIYTTAELTITNSTISGNYASTGAPYSGCLGGGIFTTALLTITDSTIENNQAMNQYNYTRSRGGGIYSSNTIVLTNTAIISNTARGWGGGIYLASNGAASSLTNCTVSGNISDKGNDNWGWGGGYGGGLYITGAIPLNITNSTISGNKAYWPDLKGGGGIYCGGGVMTVKNTIIVNNTSHNAAIRNDYYYSSGTLTDSGFNVVEYQAGDVTGAGKTFTGTTNILYNTKADGTTGYSTWNRNNSDLANQNLNLSTTPADSCGPTRTLAISDGSFAIGAGIADVAVTTDQRGVTRADPPTIGAYEYIPCAYTLGTTSVSLGISGGSGTVGVTTNYSCCNWQATSNDSWITITSGASGTGNGSVNYSVASNGVGPSRSGTMTIAGKTFTVNQADWSDSFDGNTPDQTWAFVDLGNNSTHNVTNNRLELHTEGGPSLNKSLNAYVDDTDMTDAIISARVQQITGGDKYSAYVGLRCDHTTASGYLFGITDTGYAYIAKESNGAATELTGKDISSIVTTPDDCMLKFAAVGHKLFGKAWNYGDSEPCEWQFETSDTDFGNGDAGVGVIASVASAVQAAFDDIIVTTDMSNFYQTSGICNGSTIPAGGSATVTSGGSSISVTSGSGQTHVIEVSEDGTTPVNPSRGVFSGNLINKHVEVACSLDDGNFTAVVSLHYTDSEISGINETDLRLYYYDTSSSSWRLAVEGNTTGSTSFKGDSAPTSTLGDYGVDLANNIVWAVVDHFTSFGAGGTGTGAWVLQDTLLAANTYLMRQGDSSEPVTTVAMANGDIDVWVSGAPATVLTTFTNPFGGQLMFPAVTTGGNYTLTLGSWSGGVFTASAISGTVVLVIGTTTYDMDALGTFGAGSFNVNAGSYLAIQITNSTGAAQTVLTGGLRSWLNATNSSSVFPTVIKLTSFTAETADTGVLLKWHTESEVDNAGFNIWRGTEKDGAYTKITDTLIPATGSGTRAADYQYTDDTAKDGVRYYYRLEDIDTSGASTMHGPVTTPGGNGDNGTCFIGSLLNK